MKKIIAFTLLAAVALSATFAKSNKSNGFEIAVGGAYGFTSNLTEKDDVKRTLQTNNIGFKADLTYTIQDNIGIQLDSAFLFPVGKAKVELKNDTTTVSNDQDVDSGFLMNLLLGPTFAFDIGDNMNLKIGLGFDILFDSFTLVQEATLVTPKITRTASMWNFGVAATADFNIMFADNMGIKFGLTSGIAGGKELKQKTEYSNVTKEETADYENSTFFIIPDVSFVIKF